MASEVRDPAFGLDDFKEPKLLPADRTLVNNILLVLLGKPGFYPSIPTLGMDIQQYFYKFDDEINCDEIKQKLIYQCRDFVTGVDTGNIVVKQQIFNNSKFLLFVLPVISSASTELVLGVSVNSTGKLIYNFTFDKAQTI